MTALLPNPPPRAGLCAECDHSHGSLAYGLCLFPDCGCLRPAAGRAVSDRTLTRRAKRAFAELTPYELGTYERAARRAAESDLTFEEYAQERGLDLRLLWRARRSLRLAPAAGGGVAR